MKSPFYVSHVMFLATALLVASAAVADLFDPSAEPQVYKKITDVSAGRQVLSACKVGLGSPSVSAQDIMSFYSGVYEIPQKGFGAGSARLQIEVHPKLPNLFRILTYDAKTLKEEEVDEVWDGPNGEALDDSRLVIPVPSTLMVFDTNRLISYKNQNDAIEIRYEAEVSGPIMVVKILLARSGNIKTISLDSIDRISGIRTNLEVILTPPLLSAAPVWTRADFSGHDPMWQILDNYDKATNRTLN